MVEPAKKKLDDQDHQQPSAQANLRDLGGGDQGGPPSPREQIYVVPDLVPDEEPATQKERHLHAVPDNPNQLADAENEADGTAVPAGAKAEKNQVVEHDNKVGLGHTGKGVVRKRFSRKMKYGAGGGFVAIVVSMIVFFIVQGPLQFVQLSQVLQRNLSGNEKTSALRNKGLFRYHRTGDIGETRVGRLGSEVFQKATAQLKDIGIEFERNKLTGAPESMTIDTSKNPDYKTLSESQRRSAIIADFKIADGSIVQRTGPGMYKINIDATNLKGIDFSKSLVRTSLGKLNDGKLTTAMNLRAMKKFFNLPRLFSPLEKRVKAAQNNAAGRIAAKQAEEERLKRLKGPETAKTASAKSKVKDILKNNQGKISVFLLGATGLCLVRSAADDIVTVNRASIVVPATLQAVDKIAIGSQVQSNQNFDLGQLGAAADTFTDKDGKTIWDAKALQVTAGTNNPGGKDLPADYAQAFSNKTTAANIRSAIEIKAGGIDITGAVCGPAGLIVQGALAIGLIIAGIPTGGGSWAAYAATQAAAAAATAGVIYMLQQQYTNLLVDKAVVPDVLSGPLGGNIMAWGAREAANIGARASGGVELSGSEIAAIDRQQQLEDRKEFQSKSIASRLFDVHDRRSFISSFMDGSSPSLTQTMAKMGSAILNFGHTLSMLPKHFTPQAHAAAQPYNWGFPRYGIPGSIATNPEYEDPYDNADKVAALLNGADRDSYTTKAKKCFGVNITNESGEWDVVADSDVNPNDGDYIDANCGDQSESWQRIMLFVFDTRLMTATACYGGDEQSCINTGVN